MKRGGVSGDANPAPTKKYDNDDFGSMLRVFYDRVFPFGEMFKWLSYASPDQEFFHRREFSMTFQVSGAVAPKKKREVLAPADGRPRQGDIYARYQCYGDAEDFAAAIRKSAPIKIDIGAVFNARPSEHKSLPAPIVPVERELGAAEGEG